jgi:hypothetical protein
MLRVALWADLEQGTEMALALVEINALAQILGHLWGRGGMLTNLIAPPDKLHKRGLRLRSVRSEAVVKRFGGTSLLAMNVDLLLLPEYRGIDPLLWPFPDLLLRQPPRLHGIHTVTLTDGGRDR